MGLRPMFPYPRSVRSAMSQTNHASGSACRASAVSRKVSDLFRRKSSSGTVRSNGAVELLGGAVGLWQAGPGTAAPDVVEPEVERVRALPGAADLAAVVGRAQPAPPARACGRRAARRPRSTAAAGGPDIGRNPQAWLPWVSASACRVTLPMPPAATGIAAGRRGAQTGPGRAAVWLSRRPAPVARDGAPRCGPSPDSAAPRRTGPRTHPSANSCFRPGIAS